MIDYGKCLSQLSLKVKVESIRLHAYSFQITQFFYCSVTVVPPFSLLFSPASPPPIVNPHPIVHAQESSTHVLDLLLPLLSPYVLPSSPLVTVSSVFPCLWFYFARLFVLLIRFHLSITYYNKHLKLMVRTVISV